MEGWLFTWWPIMAMVFFLGTLFIVWVETSRGKVRTEMATTEQQHLAFSKSCNSYEQCESIKS